MAATPRSNEIRSVLNIARHILSDAPSDGAGQESRRRRIERHREPPRRRSRATAAPCRSGHPSGPDGIRPLPEAGASLWTCAVRERVRRRLPASVARPVSGLRLRHHDWLRPVTPGSASAHRPAAGTGRPVAEASPVPVRDAGRSPTDRSAGRVRPADQPGTKRPLRSRRGSARRCRSRSGGRSPTSLLNSARSRCLSASDPRRTTKIVARHDGGSREERDLHQQAENERPVRELQ